MGAIKYQVHKIRRRGLDRGCYYLHGIYIDLLRYDTRQCILVSFSPLFHVRSRPVQTSEPMNGVATGICTLYTHTCYPENPVCAGVVVWWCVVSGMRGGGVRQKSTREQ